jgi:hypothetical protein
MEDDVRTRNLLFFGAAILLVASAAYVVPSAPKAAAAQDDPLAQPAGGPDTVAQPASEVIAYWTPERMAAAVPMDKVLDGAPNPVAPDASRHSGPAPMFIDGNAPGEPPGGVSVPTLGDAPVAGPSVPTFVWYGYPFPYTFSYIGGGWPQLYPIRTNGVLFFMQNGSGWRASATSMTSGTGGSRRMIWTSGTNLHDGSGLGGAHWSSSLLFCPAYVLGVPGPWGCWTSIFSDVTSGWFGGNLKYDWGVMLGANTSSYGYGRIGDVIGTQGFINGTYGEPTEYWMLGYPAAAPFDGNSIVWVTAGQANIDDVNGLVGGNGVGAGNPSTGGSGGGAWLIGAKLGAPGYLVGENSYKYVSQPGAMYSPWSGGMDVMWNSYRMSFP